MRDSRETDEVLVCMAQRLQGQVERQLTLVERLHDTGPDDSLADLADLRTTLQLSLRGVENLLVLGGAQQGPRSRGPRPVADVLADARAGVDDAVRVDLGPAPDARIAPRAVGGLVALFTELLNHALGVSHERSSVEVTSLRAEDGGVTVEVASDAAGPTPGELDELNRRLADRPIIDDIVSNRVGLFVAARIAARSGVTVRVQHRRAGGHVAVVHCPPDLLDAVGVDTPRSWQRTPYTGYDTPANGNGNGSNGYGSNGYGANGYGANGYGPNGHGSNGYGDRPRPYPSSAPDPYRGGNGYDPLSDPLPDRPRTSATGSFDPPGTRSGGYEPHGAGATGASATGGWAAPASFDSDTGPYDARPGAFDPPSRTGSFDTTSDTGAFDAPSRSGAFDAPSRSGAFDAPSRSGAFDTPTSTGGFSPRRPTTGGDTGGLPARRRTEAFAPAPREPSPWDPPPRSEPDFGRADELFGPLTSSQREHMRVSGPSPIYEAIASAWFVEGNEDSAGSATDWSTPSDAEWRAASARAARPDHDDLPPTAAGLPRRRPGTQMVAPPRRGVAPPAVPTRDREPERVRERLAVYQQGLERGRHRSPDHE